jgi:hypothetical protein
MAAKWTTGWARGTQRLDDEVDYPQTMERFPYYAQRFRFITQYNVLPGIATE